MTLYEVIAVFRGDGWRLSQQEAEAAGVATVGMLEHAPVPSEKAAFWIDLAMGASVLGGIFAMRLIGEIRERKRVAAYNAQAAATNRANAQAAGLDTIEGLGASVPLRPHGLGQNDAGPSVVSAGGIV